MVWAAAVMMHSVALRTAIKHYMYTRTAGHTAQCIHNNTAQLYSKGAAARPRALPRPAAASSPLPARILAAAALAAPLKAHVQQAIVVLASERAEQSFELRLPGTRVQLAPLPLGGRPCAWIG